MAFSWECTAAPEFCGGDATLTASNKRPLKLRFSSLVILVHATIALGSQWWERDLWLSDAVTARVKVGCWQQDRKPIEMLVRIRARKHACCSAERVLNHSVICDDARSGCCGSPDFLCSFNRQLLYVFKLSLSSLAQTSPSSPSSNHITNFPSHRQLT